MQDRTSFTAETVALMRALETHRGAGRRLFVDPYAEPFTRGRLRVLARCSRVPGLGGAPAGALGLVLGVGGACTGAVAGAGMVARAPGDPRFSVT